MLGLRGIGKIVRGKATPFQLVAAAVLGALIGFVPAGAQSAGLYALLLALLVLVNANLLVAALTWAACEALAYVLLPVSFAVGRALLDGPTGPVFALLANAPGTALLGLEYYAAAGGLVLGALIGAGIGALLAWALTRFRRRMAALEAGSEAYRRFANRRWVRALAFVLIGPGHGKTTYAQMLEKRVGNPVRPVGAALVALLVVLGFVVRGFLAEPVVTALLQRGLERVNGATVDVASAELSVAEGRLALGGLAMADRTDLDRNLLSAGRVRADASVGRLLRKRVALDDLVLEDAAVGDERATRGRLVGPAPRPLPPERDPTETKENERPIEDLLRDAARWRDRLAQLKRWLDWLAGPEAPGAAPEARDRSVAARVRAHGYAGVRARHLVADAPTFLLRSLEASGVRVPRIERIETLAIEGRNLSTHPALVEEPTWLRVRSADGRVELVYGRPEAAPAAAEGGAPIRFAVTGLPGDAVGEAIRLGDEPPVAGGTVDLKGDGVYRAGGVGTIDLELTATLHKCTLRVPGTDPVSVERLALPIGVRGPIERPRIELDKKALGEALLEAGKAKVLKRLEKEAGGFLPKGVLGGDEKSGGARGMLQGLLGGEKKDESE